MFPSFIHSFIDVLKFSTMFSNQNRIDGRRERGGNKERVGEKDEGGRYTFSSLR